ncbi:MAG TPA: tyrosine-type recombinase/integrase [Streptosporangiaceae bacterium]
MSELRIALRDYLALRRALGYQLKQTEWLLGGFVSYLEEHGEPQVTTALAIAWARWPASADPRWWHARLGAVRGFARYLASIDPRTEVPPADLLPAVYHRVTPYLYSDADITALLGAAGALSPALRAATYQTLIGLLTVSGMRIGEAIALDRADVDDAALVMAVRKAKPGSARTVPLHPATAEALRGYARLRDHHFPAPATPGFFVSTRGTRLAYSDANKTFRALIGKAGLEGRGQRHRPRAHDLRHSFAVATLLRWHEEGADVDARLPLLSAMLGHADPASTYWYLQAAPELLALVAERLQQVLGEPA